MLFIHVFRSDSNRFHNFFLCFLYWAFFSFTIFYLKKSGIKHPIITYGNKKQREKSRENDEWHFYLKIFSPPLLVLGKKTGNIWAEPTKLGPLFILINFFIYDFFEKTYQKTFFWKRNFSLPPLVPGQKLVTSDNELLH